MSQSLQVTLLWGAHQMLDVREVASGERLTIGDARSATIKLSHPAFVGAVPFVQPDGSGFRLLLPEAARPTVRTGTRDLSLREVIDSGRAEPPHVPVIGASLRLGTDDCVTLDLNELRVVARYVRPQPMLARSIGERIDYRFLSMLMMLILMAVALDRMVAITDFGDSRFADDVFTRQGRITTCPFVLPDPPRAAPRLAGAEAGAGAGARAQHPEGRVGKPNDHARRIAPSLPKIGMIAALEALSTEASGVLRPGGVPDGLAQALDRIGGHGSEIADGSDWLGSRGDDRGGCPPGRDCNGLDIGGLSDHGTGPGSRNRYGLPIGDGDKPGTIVQRGPTHVVGGLTADEIGRVVRRHWNEIRYCYETELRKHPDLSGKVALHWEIGPTGDVTTSRVNESDLHDATVESCMVETARRWKFPAPRGGGVVEVNYPFIFQTQE